MRATWPKQSDVYTSARQFRSAKRKDVRRVLKTMDNLRLGCAFMPLKAYQNIVLAVKLMEETRELLTVKLWQK